jgi:hypothetical protein
LQEEQPPPPPPNTSFSDKHKESRVKERKNIPPPSRPYLDMVSGTGKTTKQSFFVAG